MKHLRKYNENKEELDISESLDNNDEMIEYIKICFVEFFDRKNIFTEEVNDGESITYHIEIHEPEIGDYDKISEFVKNSEEITEFYKDIENCLEKVAIKYNLKTSFEYQFPPEGYITIIFVLQGTGEKKFV